MWTLTEYKRVFYIVGFIGVVLCLVPTFTAIANSQSGDEFSELYILGPGQKAENYPFNVSAGGNGYSVFLGVGNHMGSSKYYSVDIKFRNSSDNLPNETVPSSLPVLYEYRVFLGDGQTWEGTLKFSFSDIVFNRNLTCNVGEMQVNNVSLGLGKEANWDNEDSGFYYQVLIELWAFNQTTNQMQYDGRFVDLPLNMTSGT